jgi:hypothetical protein
MQGMAELFRPTTASTSHWIDIAWIFNEENLQNTKEYGLMSF